MENAILFEILCAVTLAIGLTVGALLLLIGLAKDSLKCCEIGIVVLMSGVILGIAFGLTSSILLDIYKMNNPNTLPVI